MLRHTGFDNSDESMPTWLSSYQVTRYRYIMLQGDSMHARKNAILTLEPDQTFIFHDSSHPYPRQCRPQHGGGSHFKSKSTTHYAVETDYLDLKQSGCSSTKGPVFVSKTLHSSLTVKGKEQSQMTDSANSISKAHTWKSNQMRLSAEYQRMRKLVGYIAPEQFRNPAKPTEGPCDIVPTTLQEYVEHKKYMSAMSQEQMNKNIEWMKKQIELRKVQKRIESAFGSKGRTYNNGLSPVLALPTIWSAEFKNLHLPVACWPRQSELHLDGDSREQLKTKCGRFLPAPRHQSSSTDAFDQVSYLRALPLDETGPIYTNGPMLIDIVTSNVEMDTDPSFEEYGVLCIGSELMTEIGRRHEMHVKINTPEKNMALLDGEI